MKNIAVHIDDKYINQGYTSVCYGVYQLGEEFFISLSFEQEEEYGEGTDSLNISQYPLEDILDRFDVYVSDFYEDRNNGESEKCCLEFATSSFEAICELMTIVGKHVYIRTEKEDDEYIEKLCIE